MFGKTQAPALNTAMENNDVVNGGIMIYFTSDQHFGHNAIIKLQNHPFDEQAVIELMRILN